MFFYNLCRGYFHCLLLLFSIILRATKSTRHDANGKIQARVGICRGSFCNVVHVIILQYVSGVLFLKTMNMLLVAINVSNATVHVRLCFFFSSLFKTLRIKNKVLHYHVFKPESLLPCSSYKISENWTDLLFGIYSFISPVNYHYLSYLPFDLLLSTFSGLCG